MVGRSRSRVAGADTTEAASTATPTEARQGEDENKSDTDSASSGAIRPPSKSRRTEEGGDMEVASHEGATPPISEGKLEAILAAVNKLSDRMTAMESRLATQANSLSELTETIGQLHGKLNEMDLKTKDMEKKAEQEKNMLEEKLAALRASIGHNKHTHTIDAEAEAEPALSPRIAPAWGPGMKVTPPGQQHPDAWADYLRNKAVHTTPAQALPAAPQAPRAQPRQSIPANKYTKFSTDLIWIKGYPRDLTTKQLKAEANRILGLHDIDPEEVEIIVKGFGRSFAVRFQSAEAARDFREEARDALPSWTDPRDKDVHQLKIHSDKPLFVRLRDRIFAELWKKVLPKVLDKDPSAKLGQSRGRLWVIVADCPFCLFASRPDPDDAHKFILDADLDNCKEYGISVDEATTWMELALRVVA
jgi:uncharacterized coiled-coil protein SlyX